MQRVAHPDRVQRTTKGFVCADCLLLLRVVTSDRKLPGLIIRYRECPKCYTRVRTEERTAESWRRRPPNRKQTAASVLALANPHEPHAPPPA